MIKHLVVAAAFAAVAVPAQAVTVTQWNFNSVPSDASSSTGSLVASVGSGVASLVGGTTATFASGNASGGSTDPDTSTNDSGWNLTAWAAQGAGDKSRGARFDTGTTGFDSVVVSWDQRHSNTSSRYAQFQYSTDGIAFHDFGTAFAADPGDVWYNGRSVDLSSVAGVADNASFAFRIVAAFAPGESGYVASTPGSSYGTAGTWRFDMVTVSAAPMAPVPEPETCAMLLAGLAALGVVARRRAA